jgi:hypothetical protein
MHGGGVGTVTVVDTVVVTVVVVGATVVDDVAAQHTAGMVSGQAGSLGSKHKLVLDISL